MNQTEDARGPAPLDVALDHDPGTAGTGPKGVAGKRVVGQILVIASAHGAIVRKDADIAALLATLEIESPLPPIVFATVAEIVSYVHRAEGCVTGTPERPAAVQELAW